MKGPGLRLHLDVRRLWRCPECGYERRTSGTHTSLRCEECTSAAQMKLVEAQRPERPPPRPLDLVIEYDPAWDPEPEPVLPAMDVATAEQTDAGEPAVNADQTVGEDVTFRESVSVNEITVLIEAPADSDAPADNNAPTGIEAPADIPAPEKPASSAEVPGETTPAGIPVASEDTPETAEPSTESAAARASPAAGSPPKRNRRGRRRRNRKRNPEGGSSGGPPSAS